MHIEDGSEGGQGDEFTAAFSERQGAPADEAREPTAEGAPDPADPPGSAPAAGAEDAPAPQTPPDPWAGASPELLAERDKLIGERDGFQHSDRSQRGRISALQRELAAARSTPPQQPQGSEPPAEDDEATKTKADRLKTLREDYPDVAGPLLDELDSARQEIRALSERVNPAIDASNEATIQAQERILADKHPDYREIGASQDFVDWASSQPKAIQGLAQSFDAADVATVLTLFKAERDASKGGEPADAGKPPQEQQRDDRRQRQMQGGREVPSKAPPAASGAPDDFDGAFAHEQRKRATQRR